MGLIQKSFALAQELRTDPFAIKRPMQETPEAIVPVFEKHLLLRENMVAKSVIGYGQVRLRAKLADCVAHLVCSTVRCIWRCTHSQMALRLRSLSSLHV